MKKTKKKQKTKRPLQLAQVIIGFYYNVGKKNQQGLPERDACHRRLSLAPSLPPFARPPREVARDSLPLLPTHFLPLSPALANTATSAAPKTQQPGERALPFESVYNPNYI